MCIRDRCILGLFILMISKSNSSSAAQAHEHKYAYFYDENLDCCYQFCTEPGCTEKQTQDCDCLLYTSFKRQT